jgi:hypothetical protein
MQVAETVFGAVGLVLFGTMIFYTVEILRNIWKHEDFSLSMFFLKPEGVRGFKVLIISAMIFSAGMVASAIGMVTDMQLISYFSKLSPVVLFLGYIYFLRNISIITKK